MITRCMSTALVVALAALVLVGASTSCNAQATTITPSSLVAPGSPTGWSLVTLNSGTSAFCLAPLGGLGPGALLFDTGGDGSTSSPPYPGQIWMGTNEYNGTPLASLTDLAYDTWTSNSGIYKTKDTVLKDKWSGPRQQIIMQVCIDPGNGDPKRMLYYRPRGNDFAPYVDDTPAGFHENAWRHNVAIGTAATGYWYDFQYQVSLGQSTWDDIVARYPNGTIAQPDLQTVQTWPNPTPPDTPNACGISLQWGGEMYGLNAGGIGTATPLYTVPIHDDNWWREAWGGIAWADNVRIGVDGEYPAQYDFEPATAMTAVTGSGTTMQGYVAYKSRYAQPMVVYGRVSALGPGADEFQLDEGSPGTYIQDKTTNIPIKIWCRAPGRTSVAVGQYLRVYGVLVPGYSNRWYRDGPVRNRFHTLDTPDYIQRLDLP